MYFLSYSSLASSILHGVNEVNEVKEVNDVCFVRQVVIYIPHSGIVDNFVNFVNSVNSDNSECSGNFRKLNYSIIIFVRYDSY